MFDVNANDVNAKVTRSMHKAWVRHLPIPLLNIMQWTMPNEQGPIYIRFHCHVWFRLALHSNPHLQTLAIAASSPYPTPSTPHGCSHCSPVSRQQSLVQCRECPAGWSAAPIPLPLRVEFQWVPAVFVAEWTHPCWSRRRNSRREKGWEGWVPWQELPTSSAPGRWW